MPWAFMQAEWMSPGAVEKLGVIGLLAVAVVILWRQLQKKEAQIETLTRELVEHLATLREVAAEVRDLRESRK